MKVLEFRAWDKLEKKMCRVEVINFNKGAFLVGNSPTPEQVDVESRTIIAANLDGHFCKFEDIELMQFTGLKDVKGKKIFERDIIKVDDPNWGYGGKYDIEHDGYLRILVPGIDEFINGNFEVYETRGELLGNVYENPELVK